MSKMNYSLLAFALASSVAGAQAFPGALQTNGVGTSPILKVHHETTDDGQPPQLLTSLPSDSWPVTDWYKQSVYDKTDTKVGEIMDVLVDHEGKNVAIIIGVRGFLGAGEKDIAVPFNAVHFKKKDNRWYPVMNATKEMLQSARGFKYDRNAQNWMPEDSSGTVGGQRPR